MKLSCLPVSLYPELTAGRMMPDDWFRMAHSLGLDGADLSVAHVRSRDAAYLDVLRKEAAGAGVHIVMLATYSDFTHPEAAERERQIDDVHGWIAAAAQLGVRFLRLTAGQAHTGVTEEAGLQWAAEGLMACLPAAEAAGVSLLYENHVRGAFWSTNDFTQPAARFLEVVRRTAGSDLKLLFDTANCLALGDDPVAVLNQVRERVGAVHLSDIRQVGTFEPTVIGTGVAPITQLLQILVADEFDGWMSIEEASRSGEEGFRRAVAFADAAWQEAGGQARR
ncbi:MAG: sugar phosphate isomerase/epimerase [Herpetosiphonaceae bacterium]|nr:sugar phosphate isomerase/epimerase [Herpetosiphonaceae bacterium]